MNSIRVSGTSSLLSATHNASHGTESYAFLRSIYTKMIFTLHSVGFSISCHTVKTMSEHPRPFLKTHWDSGRTSSASACNLPCTTWAVTFPTTLSSDIPLQLLHLVRSPFLGIGTNTASDQSCGEPVSPSIHCAAGLVLGV